MHPSLSWATIAPLWRTLPVAQHVAVLRWMVAAQHCDGSLWDERLSSKESIPEDSSQAAAFLTPSEVAAFYRVSRGAIYALIEHGELAAVHIGATLRIPRTALHAITPDPVSPSHPLAVPEALMESAWAVLPAEEQWSFLAWMLARDGTDTVPLPSTAPSQPSHAESSSSPAEADEPPLYYTVRQAAALLSVHPSTIRRAITDGSLPVRHIGTHLRIPRTALFACEGGEAAVRTKGAGGCG